MMKCEKERQAYGSAECNIRDYHTADQEAQYDTCMKRLLSEKIILAWILKECVSEFEQYSVTQIMRDCIKGDPKVAVIGNVLEKESNYGLLTVMMLRLGSAEKAVDKPILRLLDVLLSAETKQEEKKAILEKDFDIPMSASMSEEANIMCNLGEGIREQTVINTRVQSIIDLMDSMDIDVEKAMQLLKIKDEERKYYHDKIDEQLDVK